jgi:hypothetical protein
MKNLIGEPFSYAVSIGEDLKNTLKVGDIPNSITKKIGLFGENYQRIENSSGCLATCQAIT